MDVHGTLPADLEQRGVSRLNTEFIQSDKIQTSGTVRNYKDKFIKFEITIQSFGCPLHLIIKKKTSSLTFYHSVAMVTGF